MTSAAASPPRAYVTSAGDAARDRGVVLELWRGNLGDEARLASKFDWFYAATNPSGPSLLQLLRHEASAAWVGVAGAGPRRMVVGSRELRAGVLVDLAVAPAHRSLGPALTLQKALMIAGLERFDLLYGFPNPKAAAVFKRVGYAPLGEIVRYVRVLRHREYVARKVPRIAAGPVGWAVDVAVRLRSRIALAALRRERLTTRWSAEVDPRFDPLWADSDHGDAPIAPRDAAMARWRFDQAPVRADQRIAYLLVEDRAGRLRAWFACQPAGSVLHVRDFWSIDAGRGIGRAFVEHLARAARRRGHTSLSVELAAPAERRIGWTNAGFTPRSKRPVFGKWRDAGTATEALPLYLTSADEDE